MGRSVRVSWQSGPLGGDCSLSSSCAKAHRTKVWDGIALRFQSLAFHDSAHPLQAAFAAGRCRPAGRRRPAQRAAGRSAPRAQCAALPAASAARPAPLPHAPPAPAGCPSRSPVHATNPGIKRPNLRYALVTLKAQAQPTSDPTRHETAEF